MNALKVMVAVVGLSGMSAPVAADTCGQAAATAVAFTAKADACLAGQGLPFDVGSCRAATAACTAADRAVIDGFLKCVDALPVCSDEATFRAQFAECAAGAQLSSGCSL